MGQGHKTPKIMVIAIKNMLRRHVISTGFLERLAPSLSWARVELFQPQREQVALRSHKDTHTQSFMEQRDLGPYNVNMLDSGCI